MKKILALVIATITLIGGYILGSFYPISGFFRAQDSGSSGTLSTEIPNNKGRLLVTAVNEDGDPIIGIEIDVAEQAGPPPEWGIQETGLDGRAVFDIDPGSYFVFFNMNRFPDEYEIQPEKGVTIIEGEQTEVEFVLERK